MDNIFGFILINKPAGPTSHDIIYKLRKITGIKKIGHAGTLDPFASGLLIVAIGRQATREINRFIKMDKEYVAVLHLGATTDTYDKEGELKVKKIESLELKIKSRDIKKILKSFLGKQKQIPPMFSAKKVGGKKLYQLARKGIEIKREPAEIEIYKIRLMNYKWPLLKIRVECSSGTYIRSLAYDIGEKLGAGAYLEELKRTKIGKFNVKKAIKIEDLNKENWKKFLFEK